jgi:hypothetical protein
VLVQDSLRLIFELEFALELAKLPTSNLCNEPPSPVADNISIMSFYYCKFVWDSRYFVLMGHAGLKIYESANPTASSFTSAILLNSLVSTKHVIFAIKQYCLQGKKA